jgi:hypothetical protein
MTSYLLQTQDSVLVILVSVHQQMALLELTLYIMHTVTGEAKSKNNTGQSKFV